MKCPFFLWKNIKPLVWNCLHLSFNNEGFHCVFICFRVSTMLQFKTKPNPTYFWGTVFDSKEHLHFCTLWFISPLFLFIFHLQVLFFELHGFCAFKSFNLKVKLVSERKKIIEYRNICFMCNECYHALFRCCWSFTSDARGFLFFYFIWFTNLMYYLTSFIPLSEISVSFTISCNSIHSSI